MELAGGICFLNRLFQNKLAPCFDKQMGRYIIHRQSGTRSKPDESLEPEVPFGYLFQLAVKHLFPPIIDRRPRTGRDMRNWCSWLRMCCLYSMSPGPILYPMYPLGSKTCPNILREIQSWIVYACRLSMRRNFAC